MALSGGGGGGSEVWNQVYMIAPVKKFDRLSTIFLLNKYGGECRHGRTMSFAQVLPRPITKNRFSIILLREFWTPGGVMYEQFMGDFTYRDSESREVQLFIGFVNFRVTSLVSISYISPPTLQWY